MRSRGFFEREDPQPVQGEPRPARVDHDSCRVEIGAARVRVRGPRSGRRCAARAPSASHDRTRFFAQWDFPRPGEPPITRLAGLSRAGALSRSSSTTSRRPGLVTSHPSGTPTLLPRPVGQQRHELRERARWWSGCGTRAGPQRFSVPGLNAAPQRGLAAAPPFETRVVGAGSGGSPRVDRGVEGVRVGGRRRRPATAALTPRSALPRLSAEASSLPEASLRISSSSLWAWRPRWRAWSLMLTMTLCAVATAVSAVSKVQVNRPVQRGGRGGSGRRAP